MKSAIINICRMPLAELVPHEMNPRKHPEKGDPQWEVLRKSLDHDYFDPIVWNLTNKKLVSGHLRKKILEDAGFTHADVSVVEYDEKTHLARMIAANKLQGEDDYFKLKELFIEIDDGGFDMSLTGYTDIQIEDLVVGETEPAELKDVDPRFDEAEKLKASWNTKRGQLWQLGNHRIICADSTEKKSVAQLLGADSPHLMVTDPPYGVNYDPAWRNEKAALGLIGQKKVNRAVGKVKNDHKVDWTEAWDLFPGDVAYVWHAGLHSAVSFQSLEKSKFKIRAQIIWAKNNFAIGRGDYHWKHEPCWYAVREGRKGHWASDRSQTTLWEIDKPLKSETGHSTQKPIECMSKPITNNSVQGDYVYDPFLGSGTTLVACENLKRKCLAIELSPEYIAVCIQRWVDLTGGKPKLIK
jgi:DNA modification methylase